MGRIITLDVKTFLDALSGSLLILSIIILALFFGLLFKGFALYRSARKESKGWFWFLLIFNTFGIFPLLYLIFSKKAEN